MMQFLTDVRGTSQEMQLKLYGSTLQQRPIPYAVFSRPPITQPWEAQVSGRPIVVFAANVHGGEKTLRESLLIILRDLATPGTDTHRLLDHVVFVIVPSINPDGFEMLPRSTRGNARGIDMNRDYMKLEQPELADYVLQVLQTWHPHVVVDGHNGGAFPYNICYQGPSTASHDPKLTEVCDREIFPLIDKRMEEAGYRSWYYSGGDRERWRVGGFDPRIGRNYLGLIGSIGILFESPGGQPMEMATRSGIVAYRTVAEFVAANAEKVMKLTRDARSETIALGKSARGEVVVRMKYEPEDYPVSYLIGEGSAGGWDRPIVEVKNAQIVKKPVPTQTRPRPYAYLLETRSIESVNMLRRHHIHIEVLSRDLELEVQFYEIAPEVKYTHEYDHPASAAVQVANVATKKVKFPRGTFVIQTGQALGRVAAHMLEPETNDNVVKWNTMDYALPVTRAATDEEMPEQRTARGAQAERRPSELPIYKLMKSQALPTHIWPGPR